jgi:hypothetical protein
MLDLSFPPSPFDAVTTTYSVIHLPRAEQPLLMKSIASWLRPGGWVLVNFGAGENIGSVEGDWLGDDGKGNWGVMFWSGWGVNGSLETVQKTGLEVKVRVRDVVADADGTSFLWGLARKRQEEVEASQRLLF